MRLKRPYERYRHLVRNHSDRIGPKLGLIVIHCTEGQNLPGITDLENLGSWFDNPTAQASAHVGIDARGNSALYVPDAQKAWHCAAFNSPSLGIEMIGKSTQKGWPGPQERKTAKYVAYWSQKYRIPLRKAQVNTTSGRIYKRGVARHSDLGEAGGNHGDPGKGFNMRRLLWLARYYRTKGY